MRKIIGIFVITLLLVTALPLVSGDNPVLLNTIIVPDDYPTIKEAINNANKGDTIFVRAGTYYENLAVDKSITLIGENRETTIIDARNDGDVVHIISDNVSISGFTIKNSGVAIPPPPLIAGINIQSSFNNISENIIVDNNMGIMCKSSAYNSFYNNEFFNNGIVIIGYKSSHYSHDVYNNMVNGKPLYYYENEDDFTVPSDAGQIILIGCNRVTVSDMDIKNTDWALTLIESHDCIIQKSNFSNNQWHGISMGGSNGNTFENNTLSSNIDYGIQASECHMNLIKNNIFNGNTWIGLSLYHSCDNNVISDNIIDLNCSRTILEHPCSGIWLRSYCFRNTINDNKISNCQIGIWIGRSHHNIVKNNLVSDCHIITTQNSELNFIDPFMDVTYVNKIKSDPFTARGAGIYLVETGENDIRFNTISENDIGIIIFRSWLAKIQFNNIMDSTTGFDFIALLSLGYYPFNYWGSSITGPIMKSNRFFTLFPWSPIRISEAP